MKISGTREIDPSECLNCHGQIVSSEVYGGLVGYKQELIYKNTSYCEFCNNTGKVNINLEIEKKTNQEARN